MMMVFVRNLRGATVGEKLDRVGSGCVAAKNPRNGPETVAPGGTGWHWIRAMFFFVGVVGVLVTSLSGSTVRGPRTRRILTAGLSTVRLQRLLGAAWGPVGAAGAATVLSPSNRGLPLFWRMAHRRSRLENSC
jgi:hypothetical protein